MAYSYSTYADAFGQVPACGQADLAHILALADHEPLFARLRAYNRTGRPPYPVEAMWRAALTKYLLGLRYYAELVNLLSTNTAVWHLCGFEEGVPNASVICRFFKRLSNHPDLIEQAIDRLVDNVGQAVREHKDATAPLVGRALAIDSTDIPAWVDVQKKPYSDPDAKWGHRTNADAPDGSEFFLGYKLHLVCDAIHGIPLAYEILPANQSDSPTLPGLVDKVASAHPNFKPRYMIADKGYDALSNYRDLDEQRIIPVIPLRNTDKDGLYDQKGRPKCFGGKPMKYVRTDPGKGHLFRCPQKGCRLKNRTGLTRYCDIESYEDLEGDALRKVGRLVRTTRRWKRLYKWRPIIERSFHSLKHSRLLNQHRFRGLKKVRLHATLALLTYCATMLARVQAGQMDRMRIMRIRVPVSAPPEQMRLAA